MTKMKCIMVFKIIMFMLMVIMLMLMVIMVMMVTQLSMFDSLLPAAGSVTKMMGIRRSAAHQDSGRVTTRI